MSEQAVQEAEEDSDTGAGSSITSSQAQTIKARNGFARAHVQGRGQYQKLLQDHYEC